MSMARRPYVTTRTHDVFGSAHDAADALGHSLSPLHVAIALLREGKGVAAQLLASRVPREVLDNDLSAKLPPAEHPRDRVRERAWTADDDYLIAQAAIESRELGKEYIGVEHVLLAILRDTASATSQALERHGISFERIREELLRLDNKRPDSDASAISSLNEQGHR